MPCHPVEYPEQTKIEKEIVSVFYVLDELKGKIENHAFGHPGTKDVDLTQETLSSLVQKACLQIQNIPDLSTSSPRLLNWWIRHRIQDHIKLRNSANKGSKLDLTLFDEETLDTKLLSKNLFKLIAEHVQFQLEELESENNGDKVRYIHDNLFLKVVYLMGSLFEEQLENIPHFSVLSVNNYSFEKFKSFLKSELAIDLSSALSGNQIKALQTSFKLNNFLAEQQKKYRGIFLFTTMEQESMARLTKQDITEMAGVLKSLALSIQTHDNG